MQGNRRTDTKPEVELRSLLHRRGLRFRKDHPLQLSDINVRPDVVFRGPRVAIFIDGCYWHGCTKHKALPKTNTEFWARKIATNSERDRLVDRALMDAGWHVLRFWEHDDLSEICDAIEGVVRARRAVGAP